MPPHAAVHYNESEDSGFGSGAEVGAKAKMRATVYQASLKVLEDLGRKGLLWGKLLLNDEIASLIANEAVKHP